MEFKKVFLHRKIKQETESEPYTSPETFTNSSNLSQIKFEDPLSLALSHESNQTDQEVEGSNQLNEYKTIHIAKAASETLGIRQEVCRLCAESITDNEIYLYDDGELDQKVNYTLPITVNVGDGLSEYICQNCEVNLDLLYNFVCRVINAEKTLREGSNLHEVKASVSNVSITLNEVSNLHEGQPINILNSYVIKASSNSSIIDEAQANNFCYELETANTETLNNIENRKSHKRLIEEDFDKPRKTIKILQEATIQSEIETYKCQQCTQHFTSYFPFVDHIKHSHNIKHFPCAETGCSESFATAKSLQQHITGNHNVPVICYQCGKIFMNHEFLEKHKQKVHYYKVCETCRMPFKSSLSFEKHITLHENKNQYHCVYCLKDFKNLLTLRRHTRVCHSGDFKLLVDTYEDEVV